MTPVGLRWLLVIVSAALTAGCLEPGATRIVGPDGSALWHVHCGDDQAACFQLAGEQCPLGYELSPIFDPHDGNFLVRCHANRRVIVEAPPATAPVSASTPQTPVSPAPAATSSWRPPEVATPTEPWPAAKADGGGPSRLPKIGDVDFGY